MSGQGYLMDYNDVPPSIQNDIEEDYLKQVLELSLNEMVESIKNNLPQEPIEGDSSGLNIIIKDEDKTYNRRFNKSDKILSNAAKGERISCATWAAFLLRAIVTCCS